MLNSFCIPAPSSAEEDHEDKQIGVTVLYQPPQWVASNLSLQKMAYGSMAQLSAPQRAGHINLGASFQPGSLEIVLIVSEIWKVECLSKTESRCKATKTSWSFCVSGFII